MPNKVGLLRFSLAVFAVLSAAAHLFPSPSGSMAGEFWFNIEVVVYAIFAVAYLLGLRRWYALAVGFSVLNILLYILAGLFAIPGVSSAPLTANLNIATFDISRLFSVVSYVYLIVAGVVLLLIDKGSELEKLY
jgi:hypothetical protein